MRNIEVTACRNCGGTLFTLEVWKDQINFHCSCGHAALVIVENAEDHLYQEKTDVEYEKVGKV